jgi:hypothetical protein
MRAFLFLVLLSAPAAVVPAFAEPRFEITVPPAKSAAALDGRLLLLLSTDPGTEPRFQINDGPGSQIAFGLDVDNWKPGTAQLIDGSAFGYPVASLARLKPGEYTVQALLHRYETFHRSDGHTVKLPMDRGEGQQWNRAPGNLYIRSTSSTSGSRANG